MKDRVSTGPTPLDAALAALFRVTGMTLAYFGGDGRLRTATDGAWTLLGFAPGEPRPGVGARDFLTTAGEPLADDANPLLASAGAGQVAWPARLGWRRPNGELVDLLLFAAPTPAGELAVHLVEHGRETPVSDVPDSTSPREAVDRLIGQLVDPPSIGILIVDAAHRVRFANRAFADTWGLDRRLVADCPAGAELLGQLGAAVEPAALERLTTSVMSHAPQNEPHFAEVRRRDGRTVQVGVSSLGAPGVLYSQAPTGADGLSPAAFRAAHADLVATITDHAAAVFALAEASDRVDAAERSRRDFVHNVSHELRTPLNNVLGYLGLIVDGLNHDADEARHFARRALEGAEELHRLISDLLDLSRIESGRLALVREPFDLADAIDEAVAWIRPELDRKGLGLSRREPEMPVVALGDAGRLRQVLQAMLGNAAKFTDSGRVTIRSGLLAGRAWIEIEDTGAGLSDDQLQVILGGYAQADESSRRSRGGMGLGLTLSRGLMQAVGGSLSIRSDGPGRGALVRLELPAATE